MWVLRFKPSNNHGATKLSSSSSLSSLQSLIHAHFSTESIQNHLILEPPHFIVDYLVTSLGFSKDQAFSLSTKLTHLKSTEKPNSVVDFLTQRGLDKTQVRNIVCFSPKILNSSVDKTLEPKFRVLEGLGLTGPLFEKIIKQCLHFSSNSLDANVSYLRGLMGSDEKVIKVIQRSWWMLSSNYALRLSASRKVLKEIGLSDAKINTILLRNPGCLLLNHKWLEETVKKVQPILGTPPDSPRFVDGIEMVVSMSESTFDMKFGIFRSFGWSDLDILTMSKAYPFCLRRSEAKLQGALKFFMNELGYTAEYLATHPRLLAYSLEKRVRPRNNVLEVLKEKNVLKNKFSLCSVVALSEDKFVKDFVLPYQSSVPNLYEAYTNATGHLQTFN